MSCYFCGGSRIASIHSAPDRGVCNWSVGSMTLARRYDGEPIVRVELDTSVMLDISVNDSCGDTVSADVTADAYIEDIKYCPFCGEELWSARRWSCSARPPGARCPIWFRAPRAGRSCTVGQTRRG